MISKQMNNKKRLSIFILLLLLLVGCAEEPAPAPSSSPLGDSIIIEVAQDGMVQLTLEELTSRGLTANAFTINNVRLTQAETAVPYNLPDDQTLIFYGQASTNRYAATRPYLLEFGETGTPMAVTDAAPQANATFQTTIKQTVYLEENNLYHSQARKNDDDDLWFWALINQQETFATDLNLPTAISNEALLRLQLRGFTQNPQVENDHDLAVRINDQAIELVQFDGEQVHDQEVVIPANTLQAGTNTLILYNSAEGASFLDIVHLNWFELEYFTTPEAINDRLYFSALTGNVSLSGFSATPHLFDISDPATPSLLTVGEAINGQTTLAAIAGQQIAAVGPRGFQTPEAIRPFSPASWRDPSNEADLLIVTTSELAPAIAPLAEAREAEGIKTAVVPITEIYDAFGAGETSPSHITSFVSYAVANWATSPTYLFLVGDATSDYRNYLGLAPANIIPSPMVPVVFSGETVSDSRLADVDNDFVPDLAVGRWPVSTVAEVEDLVARTLAYEAGTAVNQTLFATDGTEAQFASLAQRLIDSGTLNHDQATILNGAPASDVATSINEGAWLTTYVGHGSVTQWGRDDVFTVEAVASLNGTSPPPIVIQLTCLTGLFAHPEQQSIAEALLVNSSGPVLQIAATSLTLSTNQEPFAVKLIQQLQQNEVLRIGDAFQKAKVELNVENLGVREIVDTFILIGDPTTKVVRPEI